jgi:hypothetical protein
MRSPKQIAEDYIAVWNETDKSRRSAMLAGTWTKDASYVDPLMRGNGQEEISGLVGAVHAKFPGYAFSLIGPTDGYAEHVRFSWALGPPGCEAVIKGTDVVMLSGNRIATVVGFLELVPAGA